MSSPRSLFKLMVTLPVSGHVTGATFGPGFKATPDPRPGLYTSLEGRGGPQFHLPKGMEPQMELDSPPSAVGHGIQSYHSTDWASQSPPYTRGDYVATIAACITVAGSTPEGSHNPLLPRQKPGEKKKEKTGGKKKQNKKKRKNTGNKREKKEDRKPTTATLPGHAAQGAGQQRHRGREEARPLRPQQTPAGGAAGQKAGEHVGAADERGADLGVSVGGLTPPAKSGNHFFLFFFFGGGGGGVVENTHSCVQPKTQLELFLFFFWGGGGGGGVRGKHNLEVSSCNKLLSNLSEGQSSKDPIL